jgi:hypothetical protein
LERLGTEKCNFLGSKITLVCSRANWDGTTAPNYSSTTGDFVVFTATTSNTPLIPTDVANFQSVGLTVDPLAGPYTFNIQITANGGLTGLGKANTNGGKFMMNGSGTVSIRADSIRAENNQIEHADELKTARTWRSGPPKLFPP